VQHQLLGGESDKRVGARVSSGGRAEDRRNQRGEHAGVRSGRPGNQVLNVIALRRRKNGKQKRCWRLAAVTRSGDDAERTAANPAAASLVTESRAPSAATNDLAGGTAAIGDGARTNDEQDAGAILERVVHGDQAIGVDDDFLGELFGIERCMQRSSLFVATGACHSAVKHAWQEGTGLRDLGNGSDHEVGNDISRFRGAARHHG